jgi:hypothetical protein
MDQFDKMLLALFLILGMVVWTGLIVVVKLPRIEMLTRGMYEELKRIYDELAQGNRGQVSSSQACRSCRQTHRGECKVLWRLRTVHRPDGRKCVNTPHILNNSGRSN